MITAEDPVKEKGPVYKVILTISCIVNFLLLFALANYLYVPVLLAHGGRSITTKFHTWPAWLTDLRPETGSTQLSETELNRLPRFRGRISHVMFTLQDSRGQLAELGATLALWERFPPCLADSSPTSVGHSNITLLFYLTSRPRSRTTRKIKEMFRNLPSDTKQCFSTMEVRHAGLSKLSQDATAGEEREHWRQVFETLVANAMKLTDLNHVLVLSSNTRPVQPDWLNQADYQCRPPNDLVWQRGSIYQGLTKKPPLEVGSLIRISPAGLYFFADHSFADFYLNKVRPWTKQMNSTDPLLTTGRPVDADRWAVDAFQHLATDFEGKSWFSVAHQFRHANFIADYHGRNVSLAQLHRDDPDVVLVTGNIVP